MKQYKEIRQEVAAWSKRNFPGKQRWEPWLGMVEELGELSHAVLKRHQKIRVEEDHAGDIYDACGDIVIYLFDYLEQNCEYDPILNTTSNPDAITLPKRIWRLGLDAFLVYMIAEASESIQDIRHQQSDWKYIIQAERLIDRLSRIATVEGFDLLECVNTTWRKVSQRDWVKYREERGIE